MTRILQPSRAGRRADLFALGCSAAIHGLALAAIVALQDGAPRQQPAQPAVAVAMVWSTPAVTTDDNGGAAAKTADSSPADIAEAVADAAVPSPATADPSPASSHDGAPAGRSARPHAEGARHGPPRSVPRPAPRPAIPPVAKAPSPPDRDDGERTDAPAPADSATMDRAMTESATAEHATGSSQTAALPGNPPGSPTPAPWSVTSKVPPAYPMSARRRGSEGDVSLRVAVGADGKPRTVTVQRGSGDPQLDTAAVRAVERWRFAVAAPMTIEIPILFRLDTNTAEARRP